MGDLVSNIVHALTILCVLIALGGNLGALFGHSWWKLETKKTSSHFGILRNCNSFLPAAETCKFRKDIFDFNYLQNYDIKPDVILMLLIISTAFGMFGLVCSLTLYCCKQDKRTWKCGMVAIILLELFGAATSIGAVVYSELRSEALPYDKGWSAILAWLGAAALFVGSILANLSLCVPPQGQDGGHVNVRPQSNYPVYVQSGGYPSYNSAGYINSYNNSAYHSAYYDRHHNPNVTFERKEYGELDTNKYGGQIRYGHQNKGYNKR